MGRNKWENGRNSQRVTKIGRKQWKQAASDRHKSVNIVARKKMMRNTGSRRKHQEIAGMWLQVDGNKCTVEETDNKWSSKKYNFFQNTVKMYYANGR